MKIIDYDIKAVFIDPKQSKSSIKVPFPQSELVRNALNKYKKLKVTIEVIEEE